MRHLAPAPLRAVLPLLVLCATPFAQAHPDEIGRVAPSPSPVTLSEPAALAVQWLRASRLQGAPPVAHTVAGVAEQAAASLAELSALLVDQTLPALTDDQRPQTLSVPQRDMLLAAFASLPPAALRQEARRLLQLDSGARTRQAVIRMLGVCASAGDVHDLVALTRPAPEAAPGALELQALRWSLTRIVLWDPRGMDELAELIRAQDPSLISTAVKVIGEVGDPRGLELLLEVANRSEELAALAISQVRKVGRAQHSEVNQAFGELLRHDLNSAEPARCQASIIALGELAHFEAVPQLIHLLQNSESLREDCLWALRRMTGLRFSDDALRWRRWHEMETAWYERELPYLLRDLHGRNPTRATAAVTAISGHRIYRHELAEELALALYRAPSARKRALCAALSAMDSEVGVPALLDTLGLPEEEVVRLAAHRALRSLTGLSLPADPQAWEAALGARPSAPAIATPR